MRGCVHVHICTHAHSLTLAHTRTHTTHDTRTQSKVSDEDLGPARGGPGGSDDTDVATAALAQLGSALQVCGACVWYVRCAMMMLRIVLSRNKQELRSTYLLSYESGDLRSVWCVVLVCHARLPLSPLPLPLLSLASHSSPSFTFSPYIRSPCGPCAFSPR